MAKAIQFTYTRPSVDVPWAQSFVRDSTEAEYADLRASQQRLLAAMDPTNPDNVVRKIQVETDNPLTSVAQYVIKGMPDDTTDPALGRIYFRKGLAYVDELINDAPIVESAEESFDGVPRTYPRCLMLAFSGTYSERVGIVLTDMRMVDVDI